MEFQHVTVLLNEMINLIVTDPEDIRRLHSWRRRPFAGIDRTAFARRPFNRVDQDEEAIEAAGERLKGAKCSVKLVHDNFSNINNILDNLGISKVNGFVFDLGVSSHQLDDGSRGFSYMNNGRLDMRMNQDNPLTAYEIVNTYEQSQLKKIIWEYGEERWANRIAEFICRFRKRSRLKRQRNWSISSRLPFRQMPDG